MARSKYNYLKFLIQISQNLSSIGSDVNASIRFLSIWEGDKKLNVSLLARVHTVNKSLVHIKD